MGLKQTKLITGKSMDEIDRESYGAGPSPFAPKAVTVELRPANDSRKPRSTPLASSRSGGPPVLSLDGTWRLAEGGTAKERLRGEWIDSMPAEVPGSVHAALVAAGRLPDPTFGRNQQLAELESYKTWWLKREFTRPVGTSGRLMRGERLVFGGICDSCTIWLNGKKVGSHRGMFGEIVLDVADTLQDENALIVKLDPIPSTPISGRHGRRVGNPNWVDTVVFNNVYGWHYSQCPSLGIWQHVAIKGSPSVRLLHPFVSARNTRGIADLVLDLEGVGSWRGRLVGTIEPETFAGEVFTFSHSVSGRGRKSAHLRFTIPDAHLWWPNGMGRQDLYRMTLTVIPEPGSAAGDGNCAAELPDAHSFTFGLRTIEMAPLPGGVRPDRYNWTFVINGKPTFVKGTGWCTLDPLMDFRRERYDRFLSLARDQHCQMIRAWGSGMPETDDFYDLCDRYGLMVMQEWPTAWNSHNRQPYKLLDETVRHTTLRIRHRASLVMYGGGNESNHPFGRAIDMMGRYAIELDGTRPFHRGEPWGGSQHAYPCYWGREHLDEALRMESVFWGEFGSACMPQAESVRRYLPADEQAIWPKMKQDGGLAYHTPVFNKRDGLNRLTQYARYFVPDDADLNRFCVGSQLAQAVALRHPLERARANWPESTGALYYKINDNFPAASWATADWYGAAKIGHYWVADAFAPLHACVLFKRLNFGGTPLTGEIYCFDDHGEIDGKSWRVLIRAFDSSLSEIGRLEDGGKKREKWTARRVGTFGLPYGITDTTPLFVVAEVHVTGRLADRTFYILNYEAEKGSLFTRPKTTLSLTVKGKAATVTNTGRRPAVGVELSRPGHLDTFTASDNYFWLDAGESIRVVVNSTDGLKVSAWNTR